MIAVEKINDTTYRVTVTSRTATIHTVTVAPAYHRKLTGDRCSPEALVQKSFEFLLAREPNTSILRSFDLPVIGRYFPEYESSIAEMLK
jgi:hypothetical protein